MLNQKPIFSKTQKDALDGKTEMTEELFWSCLQACYDSYNIQKFLGIWNRYPNYVQAYLDKIDRELADPHSPIRIEEEQHWNELKAKLVAEFGEAWRSAHLDF